MGVKALSDIFHSGREITAVKDGGSVKLGRFNFTFYETRMLHWPDSMFTYFAEDSLLFSQDAFGMHLATSERFADELGEPLLYEEGAKYFANILLPYSALVTNLLKKVQSLGLKFSIVAPDHGPIWRGNDVAKILGWYARWAEQKPTRKVVVAYGTMWQCTAAMAKAIAEGAADGGVDVKLMPLASHHRSDVATEILDAGALVVGSSTLNNMMLPWVADTMNYLKGLRPQNLVGQAFGSYGWSGEGADQVGKVLDEMKVARIGDPIKTIQMPDAETLKRCRALGKLVAEKLKETCK
jgi:flavorubredoxin